MIYPSTIDYNMAVKALSSTVHASCAKTGQPLLNMMGHPLVYAGGFSRVYVVENPSGKRFALRVWTREVTQVKERYRRISQGIKRISLEYFVDFEYYERFITVNGQDYPGLCMEWVEGQTLQDFLEESRFDKLIMQTLAYTFLKMVQLLHQKGVAHGDLQHDNIIVVSSTSLRLIDYDSLYLAELNGFENNVAGYAEYQHPARIKGHYPNGCDFIDFFSELVIFLTIMAYAQRPDLWNKRTGGVLFDAKDFINPNNSATFQTLMQLDAPIPKLAQKLASWCYVSDLRQLEPLENLVRNEWEDIFSPPDVIALPSEWINTTPAPLKIDLDESTSRTTATTPNWRGLFDEDTHSDTNIGSLGGTPTGSTFHSTRILVDDVYNPNEKSTFKSETKRKICQFCNTINNIESVYCQTCLLQLTEDKRCPKCKAYPIPSGAKYCTKNGCRLPANF